MVNKIFTVGGGNGDLITVWALAGFSQRQVWHLAGQELDDLDLQQWVAQEKFLDVQVWKASACAVTNKKKAKTAKMRQFAERLWAGLRLQLILTIGF